jgi:hypothetical protein
LLGNINDAILEDMHVTLDGWLTKYQQGGNKIKIQNSENRWEIVKKKNYLPIVAPLLRIIHWMDA